MQTSVRNSRTPAKTANSSVFKSPTPSKNNSKTTLTVAKHRTKSIYTPVRKERPKSVNHSFDFSLDTSKMFTNAVEKAKFYPEAIPAVNFDVWACREEINRLNLQVTSEVLLENKIMRDDWRKAKKSVEIQYDCEIRENDRFNTMLHANFLQYKENNEKNLKALERRRKEEEFLATKEAKLKLEMAARQRALDDLQREKIKYVSRQQLKENRKAEDKNKKDVERESYIEFIDVVKSKTLQEKERERKEREFEYAQALCGKWVKLHQKEQEVKENIEIIEKLVNSK